MKSAQQVRVIVHAVLRAQIVVVGVAKTKLSFQPTKMTAVNMASHVLVGAQPVENQLAANPVARGLVESPVAVLQVSHLALAQAIQMPIRTGALHRQNRVNSG